jgi:hypothetical protein
MEIYLKSEKRLMEFTSHFSSNDSVIDVRSTDSQDYGTIYRIPKALIISIDQDCEGMIIWWKKYSMLEAKFFTNSAHFNKYTLRHEIR